MIHDPTVSHTQLSSDKVTLHGTLVKSQILFGSRIRQHFEFKGADVYVNCCIVIGAVVAAAVDFAVVFLPSVPI